MTDPCAYCGEPLFSGEFICPHCQRETPYGARQRSIGSAANWIVAWIAMAIVVTALVVLFAR